MLGTLSLAATLSAGVLGMVVAFLSWLHRDRPGARPLTGFTTAASCWALVYGLELASGTAGATRFWAQLGLVVSAFIPVAWFVTVLEYTGRERWLARGPLAALLLEPVVFATLAWTNGAHSLVWSNGRRVLLDGTSAFVVDYGLAFWGHQAVVYGLVVAGGVLLLRTGLRTTDVYRTQSTALLGAIALPAIAQAVNSFGLAPPGFDPTAAGYVLTGVVLAWALFRSELFSLSPLTRELGRDEAVAELDDRVLVLDGEGRIVDANPAAESLLGAPLPAVIGEALGTVLPDLATALDRGSTDDVALEHDGRLRYFDVRVSELDRGRGTVTGRLVSLRDVTERRQREQRLDVLHRLLRHNLRNDLNVVRGNAELARAAATDEGARDRLETVITTVDGITERSDKIGRLTRILETEGFTPAALGSVVDDAVRSVRHERADGEITVDVPSGHRVRGGHSLTAAVEEVIENALEHGGGAVAVGVDEAAGDEDWVVLTVADDGPGIDHHEYRSVVEGEETPLQHGSGVGLWLVNWIVTQVGGSVAFEGGDRGTTVRLVLPRATPDPDPDSYAETDLGRGGEGEGEREERGERDRRGGAARRATDTGRTRDRLRQN